MEKRRYCTLKKASTNLIRIFCFSVFIFQFYLLTDNYRQFNVRKEVVNYIADEIEFPEIHIFIPYKFAFDINFLKAKYKPGFDETCRRFLNKDDCDGSLTNFVLFSKWLGHAMSLSDIFKYSYPTDAFIKRIHWAESLVDPLETGKCKINRKATSVALVLIIHCLDPHGSSLKLSRAKAIVYNSNFLFSFNLNATAMMMKLIYPGKALVEDSSLHAFANTNQEKSLSLGIRFTKHTEHLLPWPYKTMCKNYDQRKTFEDCLNANSIKRTGMLFPATTVSFESQSPNLHFNSPFIGNNSSELEIYHDCQTTVTQNMCIDIRYSFSMTINSMARSINKNEMKFFFIATSEPDSITQSKPDFPLSDYLILSGSLFSTWFGISIMGQLLAASRVLFIPYDKKCNAVTNLTATPCNKHPQCPSIQLCRMNNKWDCHTNKG